MKKLQVDLNQKIVEQKFQMKVRINSFNYLDVLNIISIIECL